MRKVSWSNWIRFTSITFLFKRKQDWAPLIKISGNSLCVHWRKPNCRKFSFIRSTSCSWQKDGKKMAKTRLLCKIDLRSLWTPYYIQYFKTRDFLIFGLLNYQKRITSIHTPVNSFIVVFEGKTWVGIHRKCQVTLLLRRFHPAVIKVIFDCDVTFTEKLKHVIKKSIIMIFRR